MKRLRKCSSFSAEPAEIFEIKELLNIFNSLADHYPEFQFVFNRQWIYGALFSTLAVWLTEESIDTFKFSWCFDKSNNDATSSQARYYANTGDLNMNRMNRIFNEFEKDLVDTLPEIAESDSYIGHAGLHWSCGPPFIRFQRRNEEDAYIRGGDILQFNIRKEGNMVFLNMETM